MKINIQKMVRVIAPFVSILVVLFLCVLPASAADLDYNDYITDVTVDGDNDIVTVSFPLDNALWSIYSGNSWLGQGRRSITYDFSADIPYRLVLYPLYGNNLILSNIPDDTLFVLQLDNDLTQVGFWDAGRLDVSAHVHYYNSSSSQEVNIPHEAADFSSSTFAFTIDKQNTYDLCAFSYYFYPVYFLESGVKTISVKSFTLQMSISSLYRLQQETGKTNTILKEVEKQLADQGQTLDDVLEAQKDANNKLDDIINGSSDQQNAADKFKDDVSGSVEDLDMFGNVMNNIPYPTIDAGSLVPEDIFYGSPYLTYTSAIQEFWNSKTLSTVTWVLGSLILISYILFGEKG